MKKKVTIEFTEAEEALLAIECLSFFYAIDEIKDGIRGHLKYQEPAELTVEEVYKQLNEVLEKYRPGEG